MCQCESRVILSEEVVFPSMVEWCGGYHKNLASKLAVIIDNRGYIRLVEEGQDGCLDHGQKWEANYCPVCGGEYAK